MNEDETYHRIENYLNQTLGPEEKIAFEKNLAFDSELSKKVRLHQLANELVIENRLLQVTQILQDQKKSPGNGRITKLITIALLLLAGTIFLFVWKNQPTSSPIETKVLTQTGTDESSIVASRKTLKSIPGTSNDIEKEHLKNQQPIAINPSIIDKIKEPEIAENNLELKEQKVQESDIIPVVQEKTITDACSTVKVEANISAIPSCQGEENGSIQVREVNGGTAPYRISIKNTQQEYVSSINIPSGIYSVSIQDKKGCQNTFYNIRVTEKICDKEYTFNPFIDEILTFPTQEQFGTLSIYERSGNLYYTKEFEPFETILWNGSSKNGELNPGYFIFAMKLKDGQVLKGGITIVR